jgi:hypothetical protein
MYNKEFLLIHRVSLSMDQNVLFAGLLTDRIARSAETEASELWDGSASEDLRKSIPCDYSQEVATTAGKGF